MIHRLAVTVLAMLAQGDSPIVLPAPTGAHPVGTLTKRWTDPTRSDAVGAGGGGRHLSARIWYPARPGPPVSPAAYAPDVDTGPGDYSRLMRRVRPRASADAPFAREIAAAPVLVFSTGRSMAAYDYTSLAEDLASHGYVVVGVESPQLSRFVLPGGEPIPPLPPPPLEVLQRFDRADAFFEPMIDLVAEDLRYVRQRLSDLDRGDPILGGHLSLDAIGMMGHSNGALAESRACARQPECRAFLGIEGTQAREVRKQGIDKPYALLISEQSLGYDKENVYRELGTHARSRYAVIIVRGAGHNTFTDLLLVRPTLFPYPIDPARGVAITRAAVRGFFDATLRGRGMERTLKATMSPYDEVTVQPAFPDADAAPP